MASIRITRTPHALKTVGNNRTIICVAISIVALAAVVLDGLVIRTGALATGTVAVCMMAIQAIVKAKNKAVPEQKDGTEEVGT